jgi:hypothetical protein
MQNIQLNNGVKLITLIYDKGRDQEHPIMDFEKPFNESLLRAFNKDGYGIFESANAFSATDDEVKASGKMTRRQKIFLTQLLEVYADLDVCKEGEALDEIKREELKKHLKNALDEYCPPTYYVITKNGIQPHWAITETKTDEETQDTYKNVIKGIIEWSEQHGGKGDQIFDTPRVLRVPGYYHNKGKPYLVTQEKGSGKTHTLDELRKYFWHEPEAKKSKEDSVATDVQGLYDKINSLDIKMVVTDVWKEKGHSASFDSNDHLLIDGAVTATFKGRNGPNYMATSSGDYPAKGNSVMYTAETLGITNKEAFTWLCAKYGITTESKLVSSKLPAPITAEELGREVFSDGDWMIHRLIPKGQITVMSAPPSSYKTMTALEWAINITRGTPAYGNFSTTKSNVLYVSEDGDHQKVFQNRVRILGGDFSRSLFFYPNVGFKVNKDMVDDLLGTVKNNNIKFVIFDSLRGIIPQGLSEMDSGNMRQVINDLRPLTAAGVTILIIHHDRKKPAGSHGYSSKDINDVGEMMSGSADIRGAVDCHISTRSGKDKKDGQSYVIVTQTKCREDELLPPFKELVNTEVDTSCKTSRLWFTYGGDPSQNNSEVSTDNAKEDILELLRKNGDPVCRGDIIAVKPGGFADRKLADILKTMRDIDKTITSISGGDLGMTGTSINRTYYRLSE